MSCKRTEEMKKLVGATDEQLDLLIGRVQMIMNNGFWFSDACQIEYYLYNTTGKMKNFNKDTANELFDFVADCVFAPAPSYKFVF